MPRIPPKGPSQRTGATRTRAAAAPRASHAPSAPPHAAEGTQPRFELEAPPILATLGKALADLLRALPEEINGPRDLERALDIDYVLAWRTYKFATAADPAAVGADVPRAAPMKRLLDAAKRKRVRAATIDQVRSAYADFEALVRRHAGDDPKRGPGSRSRAGGRAVFDALISGVSNANTPALDLHHRRNAFKSNSYLWGVQAQAALRCVVWHPSAQEHRVDALLLSGFTHLNALRPGVPVLLKHHSSVRTVQNAAHGEEATYTPPSPPRTLEEFCSRPIPRLKTSTGKDGYVDIALEFDGIGKGAAVDYFSLENARGLGDGTPQTHYRMLVTSVMPAEALHLVMLVPRGVSNPATRSISIHGNPTTGDHARVSFALGYNIPAYETVEYLGSDLGALTTPDFPRITEALTMALAEQKWQNTVFDIYRCRVRYPILHALVNLYVTPAQPR